MDTSEMNTKDLIEAIATYWMDQDPVEGESVPLYGQLLKKATEQGHFIKLENKASDENMPKDDFGR